MDEYPQEELAEYFEFLDDLRESGETNMFGAGPYLVDEFGMPRPASHKILKAWMDTFDSETTPAERAARAIEA